MSHELGYVSATLKQAAPEMSEHDRRVALDCYRHWRSEWERVKPEDPLSVAFTVNAEIDERVQRMLTRTEDGRSVTCSKGCAACCRISVDISTREAALLVAVAADAGIEIDEAKLQRQAASPWRDLTPEDRSCVFLAADRTCRVYEHRPGACRKYHVLSDPDLCDMDKHRGGKVGIVFDVQAEIIFSAALTVYGAGSMPEMLLQALKQGRSE